VFPIRIPPLRERKEDIPLILNHFLKNYHNQHARRLRIAPQALDILVHYDWPGNVSEMINLMLRLIITVNGTTIQVRDLPMCSCAEMNARDEQTSLSRLELMERNEIVTALARNNWFQSRTARELGLTFRQMNYRVKKFGLERLVLEHRSGATYKSRNEM
jgi:Nif-specific regulatory protein